MSIDYETVSQHGLDGLDGLDGLGYYAILRLLGQWVGVDPSRIERVCVDDGDREPEVMSTYNFGYESLGGPDLWKAKPAYRIYVGRNFLAHFGLVHYFINWGNR